jgi:hypothetical protein
MEPDMPRAQTWRDVTARRMARNLLVKPSPSTAAPDVARALCGVHAQILQAAELSIGRRNGSTRSEVQRALWVDRTLVKTFGPRGTVHLLATADLPMWTGALSALPSSAPAFPEPIRFTPDESEAVIAGIGSALADAELTIDELTEALRERVGPWAVEETMPAFQVLWPRWRQLTSTAAHRGVLCFGHERGRNVTYTNPQRWLPGFMPEDGATALRRLVLEYLYAYGPATPQHFAKWLNVPPARGVEAFETMTGELERVQLERTTAWVVAGDTAPVDPAAVGGIRLLPYFDAYVVAAQPRALLYPGAAGRRGLSPSGQAGNYPVMLVDGVVGGVWHQRRSGRRLMITVEPLAPLSAAHRRQLEAEVALVGSVMEADPTLVIGDVTVGPHA